MEKNELAGLKKGQFVMYCGETDYSQGLIKGEIFEVIAVGDIGFRMKREKRGIYTVTVAATNETNRIKHYKVVPNPTNCGDETELDFKDYEMLIDYALDIKDFNWARELFVAGQKFAI